MGEQKSAAVPPGGDKQINSAPDHFLFCVKGNPGDSWISEPRASVEIKKNPADPQ